MINDIFDLERKDYGDAYQYCLTFFKNIMEEVVCCINRRETLPEILQRIDQHNGDQPCIPDDVQNQIAVIEAYAEDYGVELHCRGLSHLGMAIRDACRCTLKNMAIVSATDITRDIFGEMLNCGFDMALHVVSPARFQFLIGTNEIDSIDDECFGCVNQLASGFSVLEYHIGQSIGLPSKNTDDDLEKDSVGSFYLYDGEDA